MTTELYGGAITISKLPNSFIDISQIRQVPDTQEVFINQLSSHNDSHDVSGSFDHSFIIDLLERVDPIDYQEAIHLHLQDIVLLMFIINQLNKLNNNNNNNKKIMKMMMME